ncbi:MAG: YhdP family protein [Vibrionaceae bacterium]
MRAAKSAAIWGKRIALALLIALSLLTLALRVTLPQLDKIKVPLQQWVKETTGSEIHFSSLHGRLRFLLPSLTLNDLVLTSPAGSTLLSAKRVDVRFDLLESLFNLRPTFTHFVIRGLHVDLTKLPKSAEDKPKLSLQQQIDQLFFIELQHFSLHNSTVIVKAFNDRETTVQINALDWENLPTHQLVQGNISVAGTSLNKLQIKGEFSAKEGLELTDGKFYLQANDLNLADWIAPYIRNDLRLTTARVNSKVWLELAKGEPVQGRVEIVDSALAWMPKLPTLEPLQASSDNFSALQIHKARFELWRENGELRVASEQLDMQAGDKRWDELFVQGLWARDRWQLNADHLDLENATALKALFPVPEKLAEPWKLLAPKGVVHDLRLSKQANAPLSYSLRVDRLEFDHWGYLPQTKNLTVGIKGHGSDGSLELMLADTKLPYGAFFQDALPIKQATINATWQEMAGLWKITGDKVAISSPHLDLEAQFSLTLPQKGSPYLSLYGETSVHDVAQLWRYLPAAALSPNLLNFLTTSLKGGQVHNAKIVWDGALADFPYRDKSGIFQVSVPLRNGKFNFSDRWPPLHDLDLDLLFENDGMYLKASRLAMPGVKMQNVVGRMAPFHDKELHLQGSLVTSGGELTQYMLASPLSDSVGSALAKLHLTGPIAGKLTLDLPFDGREAHVSGRASLQKGTLTLDQPALTLTDVAGEILFENDKVWSPALSANLLGQPLDVTFNGKKSADPYLVNVKAQGRWEANALQKALDFKLIESINGQGPWDLNLDLSVKNHKTRYDLALNADLAALRSQLPSPFDTSALRKGDFKLKVQGDNEKISARMTLPNFKTRADIALTGDAPVVTKSQTIIGYGKLAKSALDGNTLNVDLTRLSWPRWKEVFDRLAIFDQKAKQKSLLPMFTHFETKISKVQLGAFDLNRFSLKSRQTPAKLGIALDSNELSGEILWDRVKDHLAIDMKKAAITLPVSKKNSPNNNEPRPKAKQGAAMLDSALLKAIPNLTVSINDLWLQGHSLGKLQAQVSKTAGKLSLNEFSLKSNEMGAVAKGDWHVDSKGNSKSHFRFDIQGKNSSRLMEQFSLSDGILGAKFRSRGDLNFVGAPWQPKLATLNGKFNVQLDKGYISGIGGGTRVLALFSLDSLLRKIQFDFSGTFEKGLAFDLIKGNFLLADGVMSSKDIEMQALAGDMFLQGEMDFYRNQIDAHAQFIPDFTSGLPVLTAFAATPHVGLYVYAVAKMISPVIDAITQVEYKLSGSIDSPSIKELSRKKGVVALTDKIKDNLLPQKSQ